MEYREFEVERIARQAFEAARKRRGRVASVDKANVLETSRMWREVIHRVHDAEYADIELEDVLVDNAAMQLISRLEPHNRGAYGGCIGFIGLNGSLNQAITIRTFVSRNGVLWFQAGGGIVAKSNDEYELQEVNNKLGALKKAIEMAEKM